LLTFLSLEFSDFHQIPMSLNNAYLCIMSTIRQNKIESVIQGELSQFFQRHAGDICLGAMVSVTVVRVTSDLSLARCYISCFAGPDKKEVLESVRANTGKIRGEVGRRLKNMRKIPELQFHIDDSMEYAAKIDELLKK
jgi:ribosome-binding factor A